MSGWILVDFPLPSNFFFWLELFKFWSSGQLWCVEEFPGQQSSRQDWDRLERQWRGCV